MTCASLACRIGEQTCAVCISAKRRAAAAVAQGNRRALADRRRADLAYWLTQEPDLCARRACYLMRQHAASVGKLYPYGYESVRKDLAGICKRVETGQTRRRWSHDSLRVYTHGQAGGDAGSSAGATGEARGETAA